MRTTVKICVMVKQTFDTEEKIALQAGKVVEDGVKWVLNPYDEYAVEEAIRLKEQHGGSVVVVSVGPERVAEALRTALAMGADEAALISDEGIGGDERSVATALAAFAKQDSYDIVLGGSFSIDTGGGQVAVRVAQLLDVPHVSSITRLTVDGGDVGRGGGGVGSGSGGGENGSGGRDGNCGTVMVLRDAEGDTETIQAQLPALFTAQQGLNEPRYPSLAGIMKAKKKPLRRLRLTDLPGLSEGDMAPATERVSLALPPARQAGRKLAGTPAEQAAELVRLLRDEAKVSWPQG